jgi:DNA polymerase-3 subunit delta
MGALSFDAFRRSLQKGEFFPTYYLHGDENFLKEEGLRLLLAGALDEATRDFNLDKRRAGEMTAEDFLALALTPPLLAERRAVVLTDVDYLAERRTRAQNLRAAVVECLRKPIPGTLLVLVQPSGEKPDPELSLAAAAVDFAPLEPARVMKWIVHHAAREGLEIEAAAAAHLHQAVGDDLAQLAAEVAKLRGAVAGRAVTVADVTDLVGVRRGETVHDFTDAVVARDFATALGMVSHLLEAPGVSGVRLVTALATSITWLAYARALLDGGVAPGVAQRKVMDALGASRPMGLRRWGDEVRLWVESAPRWSAAQCEAACEALLDADRRLKTTSLGEDAALVREAIMALAARAERAA